jgi:hypothetical protein
MHLNLVKIKIHDSDTTSIFNWLSAYDQLPLKDKKLECLLIQCSGTILENPLAYSYRTFSPPDFDTWAALISRLQQSGLEGTQIA